MNRDLLPYSCRDPPRRISERCRGQLVFSTATSRSTTLRMHCVCSALLLFICFASTSSSRANAGPVPGNVFLRDEKFQGERGNGGEYFENIDVNGDRRLGVSPDQPVLIEKLRKLGRHPDARKAPYRDVTRAEPVSLKAEINFGFNDLKEFVRSLVLQSSSYLAESNDAPQRVIRDTEPQADVNSNGPWTSDLGPTAVVGTIVGGTLGVFLIVVLAVIFCSYKNYPSADVRRRAADVYDGQARHHAEHRM